ncbi:hypothetical protein ACLMJK_008529 [Lecanora helva]
MDPQNCRTASTYINNLLLSRGLLRNGTPIEFATPEQASGGVDATMAQIMNLVHDLILRRDRESDTLANLSQNLQHLRTSTSQHTQTIARLETRNADLDRQLALITSQDRAARATLRTAETRNRALREEIARLKGSVSQIRSQCATDIRRRDGEIQRLKRHLEGRRGRDGNSGQVGVMVVTPGFTKGPQGNRSGEVVTDLESPTYSLKQETTEFLTQLSQGLSDENDALIGLVRSTLATLRSLQGLSTPEQDSDCADLGQEHGMVIGFGASPPSYDVLATSTDEVLEHLRGLLTNPSFVPLEEVEIREEEIHRLREGWEKMAVRWKEAMALLDGWKKRMVDTGDTINLDDLNMGMELGSEIPTAQDAHEGSLLKPAEESDIEVSDIFQDSQVVAENPHDPNDRVANYVNSKAHATKRPLSATDGNCKTAPSPRRISSPKSGEENVKNSSQDEDFSLLKSSEKQVAGTALPKVGTCIPAHKQHRIPSPNRTVEQKLEYAQAEAEAARKFEESKPKEKSLAKRAVTKKLKGSRRRSTLSPEELENLMGIF